MIELNKKKMAIAGGSVLLVSAIGVGSYFALHKSHADNDMFALNIPKPAEPVQQASVSASTPIASQPVAEAPKATAKRWQDMTYKECMAYNDEYNIKHSRDLGNAKNGIQALHDMEDYKPPKCDELPDAPNKIGKVPAPTQEAPKAQQEQATPTPEPKPVYKVEKKAKKVHVETVRESAPAHSSPVQPTPQPATKAWYQ